MKKNYFILCYALLNVASFFAQESQKNFINYQGLARTADNELMANETMVIGIDLKIGGAAEAATYSENHTVTTDANGVFSLKIGNGDLVSGDYNNFQWGEWAIFVTISINGSQVGTTEMTAVPYAISSGDSAQEANQVPYDNSVSGLAATNAQDAIDELVDSGGVDADADPTNEIQTISFNATTSEINLTDGGTITIPSGGTDADADPTNEFQNLSFDATTNELSLSDGNAVTIPSGGTDADADPTNEIQILSFDAGTNELSLTDGGVVTIPSAGTDADADPTNEIQSISFDAATNELSLTDGGTVTIPSGGTDADADPTNEIQDISLVGDELSISGGSTLILPTGGGGTDDQNAAEVPFDNTGTTLAATDTQTALEELALSGVVDTDDQALVLTGDVLTIQDGAGSVDLASYRDDADSDPTNEVDVTAQSGILLGDGTDVTGLEGTADGQVPKWDATASAWLPGTDETGSGGNSLWSENGNNIHFDTGNVGIGNTNPGVEAGAGKYLTVATGTSPSDNAFAAIEIQGGQGSGNRPVGRLDFISNSSAGNSAIARVESRTSGFAQFRGDLAFSTKDGASFATSSLEERMTIKYNGNVGVGTTNPQTTLDVAGGQWDLNNTKGDFGIGNISYGLRLGVALGGAGAGDVRIRSQGGTDRILLGSGDKDVMSIERDDIIMSAHLEVTGEVRQRATVLPT